MFESEQAGLELLGNAGKIRTPHVYLTTLIGDYQVLLMEWVPPGTRTKAFWKSFGAQLGSMHQVKAKNFGLATDNYMGALPQSNTPAPDWNTFFYEQRIIPQVKLARDKGLLTTVQSGYFSKLPAVLPDLFPDAEPCLLHGDLWSGNFLCDNNEKPVLIDPAAYFGHPAVDLALTTLFGGFDKEFYEAYNYFNPLPANHTDQWDCCNLYPLLIHLNLFGKSYLGDVLSIVQRY
jgi:fructosamine-3-kinase